MVAREIIINITLWPDPYLITRVWTGGLCKHVFCIGRSFPFAGPCPSLGYEMGALQAGLPIRGCCVFTGSWQHSSDCLQVTRRWVSFGHLSGCKITDDEPFLELLNLLLDWGGGKYKSPTRVWLGPNLYLLLTTPDDVQTVLNAPECLNRDKVYKFIEPLMGLGLVTLPGQSWREHRKFLNPTFNLKILKSFVPIFNNQTNILRDILSNEEENRIFDIYKYMDRCTLDTVCRKDLKYYVKWSV